MVRCEPTLFKSKGRPKINKVSGSFTVTNDKGLHTRPSTELVKCASTFKSQVRLTVQDNIVNAKSILGILMLAAAKGTNVFVEAIGEDAEDAINSILNLAQKQFHVSF